MPKHPVPDAALDADIATIAQKGAGKTYLNRGLVERLLDQRRRVVVLDPLNSWWGLKALANGKPGYPVAVIGGPNADVPLDPHAGEKLGEFVATSEISVVLDVSELKRGELIRFATDFLAALYRLNRDPLWLVLEEADVFAPQQPMGDATFLLHHVDQIARRGRARGFRLWTITQRPAKLHKDVLTQTSTLIMLRLRSPQDRAAAEAWIVGNAEAPQAREIVASLASLPVGEGWVWSPDHDLLARAKFPPIRTLDTSATPQAGEERRQSGKLAQVDLVALRQALSTPPQPVVDHKKAVSPASADAITAARKEGYQEGYRRGLDDGERQEWVRAFEVASTRTGAAIDKLRSELGAELAGLKDDKVPQGDRAISLPPMTRPMYPAGGTSLREFEAAGGLAASSSPAPPPARVPKPAPVAGDQPGPGAAKLLQAIAGAPRLRLPWSDVAVLAVMSGTAGYTRGAINDLRALGLVSESSDGVAPAARTGDEQMLDPVQIVDNWRGKVGGAGARILAHIWVMGPQTAEQVAAGVELSPTAGYTRAGWKKLRSNNLVREVAGGWDVAQVLRDLQKAGRS